MLLLQTRSVILPRHRGLGLGCLIASLVAVGGCSGQSSSTDGALASAPTDEAPAAALPDMALQDALTSIPLTGNFHTFERVTLPGSSFTGKTLEISYHTDAGTMYRQRVSADPSGNFTFLVLPVAEDADTPVNVSLVSEGAQIGDIMVLPLPPLDSDRQPGEIAIAAMNSLLFGLRNELAHYEQTRLTDHQGTDNVDAQLKALMLSLAIERFQSLIRAADNVIVFNSPVRHPESGEVVLDGGILEKLDRMYQTLFSNLIDDGMFLDEADPSAMLQDSMDMSAIGDTAFFRNFYLKALERYRELNGVRTLATLMLDDKSDHAVALNMMTASMFPAIAAQVFNDEIASHADYLQAAAALLRRPEMKHAAENHLYIESLYALENLASQLADIEASGQQ